MPQLTLTNNLSKIWNIVPVIIENEVFNTGGGLAGYTENDNVDIQLVAKRMRVVSTADSGGYVSNSWTVMPGQTYNYSIDYYDDGTSNNIAAGTSILGSTDGGTQYHNVTSITSATLTGSFLATGNTVYMRLTNPAGTGNEDKWLTWDNIVIEEDT